MGCSSSQAPEPKPQAKKAPASADIFANFSQPAFSLQLLLKDSQDTFDNPNKDSANIDFPRFAYKTRRLSFIINLKFIYLVLRSTFSSAIPIISYCSALSLIQNILNVYPNPFTYIHSYNSSFFYSFFQHLLSCLNCLGGPRIRSRPRALPAD